MHHPPAAVSVAGRLTSPHIENDWLSSFRRGGVCPWTPLGAPSQTPVIPR